VVTGLAVMLIAIKFYTKRSCSSENASTMTPSPRHAQLSAVRHRLGSSSYGTLGWEKVINAGENGFDLFVILIITDFHYCCYAVVGVSVLKFLQF
jgi:hypothetical protein